MKVVKVRMTSIVLFVQILGSGGTIVWVMLLSTIFLRAKYRLIHFAGVGVCLLGIGALAYTDIHNGKSQEGVCMCVCVRVCMYTCTYLMYVCMYISCRAAPILVSISIGPIPALFVSIGIGKVCYTSTCCWYTIPTIKMNFYAPVEIIFSHLVK